MLQIKEISTLQSLSQEEMLLVGGDGLDGFRVKSEGSFATGQNQTSLSYQNPYGWGVGANTSGTFSGKAPLGNSVSLEAQYNTNGSYQGSVTWRTGSPPPASQPNIFSSPF